MRIINTMFGKYKGGIEQACLDYHEALEHMGHEVTTILHPHAKMRPAFEGKSVKFLTNFSHYDPIAILRLRSFIQSIDPHIVICHGARAAQLSRFATPDDIPVAAITHNYSIKRLLKSDALLTITNNLKEYVHDHKFPEEKIFVIPNMIRAQKASPPKESNSNDVPIIGTMGRFVHKKGIDIFIEALAILKERGVKFKAVIGGDGEEKNHYYMLSSKYKLEDTLRFHSWITDKEAFFDNMDIFCLPSIHEPFGIVLLEAALAGKAIVTTDAEGPSEILTHEENALMVPRGKPKETADALERLIKDPALCKRLAEKAHTHVVTHYDLPHVAKSLDTAIKAII